MVILAGKAQADQHLLGAVFVAIAAQVLELLAQRRIGGKHFVGAIWIGHLGLQVVQPGFHGPQRLEGGHHLLPQGPFALQRCFLRQKADAQALGAVHIAAGRLVEPGQDAQQRCLARAVAAHQGDPVAVGHAARHIPEYVVWIVRFGDPFGNNDRHKSVLRMDRLYHIAW